MATDAGTELRDALMGMGCQPDERTSEQKVRDFRNAACEEAPSLVLPLLCCLRETDEESLRRQLPALRQRLLQVANSLSSFVPGWKKNLADARQTLQEQISEDYRISWGRELIYHSTACETLGDAVRRLHHEVWRLCELPDGKLTADSVRQSLELLDVEAFRNCCVASCAEIEKAEFLNGRALQESMNDQKLMELLKGFVPDECDGSIAVTDSANRPTKTLPDSPEVVSTAQSGSTESNGVKLAATDDSGKSDVGTAPNIFQLDGDVYLIEAFGESGRFSRLMGFKDIQRLIQTPDIAVGMSLLVGETKAEPLSTDAAITPEALNDANDKLRELIGERESINANSDSASAQMELSEVQNEIDQLTDYVSKNTGLRGRPKDLNAKHQTAMRSKIYSRIATAIAKLKDCKPPLLKTAAHFEQAIHAVGDGYVYEPGSSSPAWHTAPQQ